MIIEEILVVIRSLAKGRGIEETKNQLNGLKAASKNGTQNLVALQSVLEKQGLTFNANGKYIKENGTKLRDQTKKTVELQKATSRFRGEYLSLMFVSMGVSRVLNGMISTVMELTGVNEGWTATLISVLGDVLFPLSDVLWDVFDAIDSLSPTTKNLIAVLVLLGAGFASLGVILPQLILLADGFGLSLGAIALTAGTIAVSLAGLVLIVEGLSIVFQAIEDNDTAGVFNGIAIAVLGLGAVLLVAVGWIPAAIAAVVSAVIYMAGIIYTNWDKIVQMFQIAGRSIWKDVTDTWEKVKWAIMNPIQAVEAFVKKTIENIKGFFSHPLDLKNLFTGGPLLDYVIGKLGGAAAAASRGVSGSYQFGGPVNANGVYQLHAGEYVVPPGSNVSPNIVINANVASDIDIRRLAEEVSRVWVSDFRKYTERGA